MDISITGDKESPRELGAISHLTIAVGDESLYNPVLNFYQMLGFVILSKKLLKFDSWMFYPPPDLESDLHPTVNTEINERDESHDTTSVTSFAVLPTTPISSGHNKKLSGIYGIFRVVLCKSKPVKTIEDSKRIASQIATENCDLHPLMCLVTTGPKLEVISNVLKSQDWPYIVHESNPPFIRNKIYSTCQDRNIKGFPESCKSTVLHTCDPAGNWITFTNRISPFDGQVVQPPTIEKTKSYGKDDSFPIQSSFSSLAGIPNEDHSTSISVAILTSGGDSSGMNAAVRASVRTALQLKHVPYIVYGGYKGLVDGGKNIVRVGWDDVRAMQSIGGTCIGTARCSEFFTTEGRLNAVSNLIERNITALVVIGGDGSLTGANVLKTQWKSLMKKLQIAGKLSSEIDISKFPDLKIVGLVGSIDNDMICTDYTIGAYTSLHRICESLDALISTALSHRRAFVVEVMGRRCGWLGLMTAVAVGAHYVFIPESPPPFNRKKYGKDWRSELCDLVSKSRKSNNYRTLVILSEGAVDMDLNPIKSDDVAEALSTRIGVDTRLTCLGHVQRGGKPCAYDRYLATVQGVNAIDIISSTQHESCSIMVGIKQNKLVQVDLMEAVTKTLNVSTMMEEKNFDAVLNSRGDHFRKMFNLFILTCREDSELYEGTLLKEPKYHYRVGIVTIGAPAGGINAAVRSATRLILKKGWTPIGIKNGMYGLSKGHIKEISWFDTIGMQVKGGSVLGTSRTHPRPLHDSPKVYPNTKAFVECGMLAYNMGKYNINALVIIGGFEAITSQLILTDARRIFPSFRIPIVCIPATISNNVPSTEFSIGCDTALNVVVEACDRIKMSADATRERLYVIEVQGKNCGYLAAVAGLTSGASRAYIPEIGVTLKKLCNDFDFIKKFSLASSAGEDSSGNGRIVLISDGTSKTYTCNFICHVFQEYLEGALDIKPIVLGHLQQGGIPSPFDRLLATLITDEAIQWISNSMDKCKEYSVEDFPIENFSVVVGSDNTSCKISSIYEVINQADIKARRQKQAWWINLYNLVSSLNRYSHNNYNFIKKSNSNSLF